jgi:nitrate/nitrite-specific signal transduction histidine kinase
MLRIRDNGVGIPSGTTRSKGMGLQVMRHRADAIGGSLLVHRHRRGGTEVVCTVPRQALQPQDQDTKRSKPSAAADARRLEMNYQ